VNESEDNVITVDSKLRIRETEKEKEEHPSLCLLKVTRCLHGITESHDSRSIKEIGGNGLIDVKKSHGKPDTYRDRERVVTGYFS